MRALINKHPIFKVIALIAILFGIVALTESLMPGFHVTPFGWPVILIFIIGLYQAIKGRQKKRITGIVMLTIAAALTALSIMNGGIGDGWLKMPPLTIQGQIVNSDNQPVADQEIIVILPRLFTEIEDISKEMSATTHYTESHRYDPQIMAVTDAEGFFHISIPATTKAYGGAISWTFMVGMTRDEARETISFDLQIPPDPFVYDVYVRPKSWRVIVDEGEIGVKHKLTEKYPFKIDAASVLYSDHGDMLQIVKKKKDMPQTTE